MQIVDLHHHTTYSYDGSSTPDEVIQNAIAHGVSVLGITDHQFSIGTSLYTYVREIRALQRKYQDHIRVLCGLEIGTRPAPNDFLTSSSEDLDYCLFESLDHPKGMDFYEFLEWQRQFRCPRGLAHTDIFRLQERYGADILQIMREENLFWELNTSGNYIYYYDFLTNQKKQKKVQKSGIRMSIGSDTHWVGEYSFSRLTRANQFVSDLGVLTVGL